MIAMPHYKNLEKLIQNIGIKTTSIFRNNIRNSQTIHQWGV